MRWAGFAGPAAAVLVVAGCGAAEPANGLEGPGLTATASPTQPVALTVRLSGTAERRFDAPAGVWRVCDRGTVTNPAAVVARAVVVAVAYVDHGTVIGSGGGTRGGGALGDLPPGATRAFTVCGTSPSEPDQDRVTAQPLP